MIEAVADHIHTPPPGPTELRAKGRRVTRQRELIWETLTAEPERHLSAEDVVESVRARMPQVSASTIYRTLELLVEEGLLLRTDLGGDRAYYEPAREHAHHHLVCESCGAVEHLHDEQLGDLRECVRASAGFAVGRGEITLFGLCARCRPAADAGRRMPTGQQ
jgi:Fur family transcriptional regulator, ferric uptake regulator